MIDATVIARLIELGRTEPNDQAVIRSNSGDLRFCSSQVVGHWTEWRASTEPMPSEDLVALTKGLALAEQYLHWGIRGSVSPVIDVYNEIDSRGDYELSWNTAKWIVEHLENPYAPFGHLPRRRLFEARLAEHQIDNRPLPKHGHLSADLSSEYEAIKQLRAEVRLQHEEQERLERQHQLLRRQQDHETKHKQTRAAWIALVDKTEQLTALERLQFIAESTCPISQFPHEYSVVSEDVLAALTPATKQALIKRLANRRSNPWRKLLIRLTAIASLSS